MTQPAAVEDRRPSRLLGVLLVWTALTTVIFWLPAVRGLFDGPSYEWSLGPFGGAGVSGAYWFPLVGTVFAIGLQVLGLRGARFPFYPLLVAWHLLLLTGVVFLVLSDPDDFRFRGDSLGIDISLVFLGPLLFGIPAVLSILSAWKDARGADRAQFPWKRCNTLRVLGLLAFLPVQFVLFRRGVPGSTSDAIGVVITILQWAAFGWAVRPLRPRVPKVGIE